jgi:hypothetical protein
MPNMKFLSLLVFYYFNLKKLQLDLRFDAVSMVILTWTLLLVKTEMNFQEIRKFSSEDWKDKAFFPLVWHLK